ncbi:hypothetical protein MNBD_PLANCTO02-2716 [hydrothermal vent metagenome]|uniref:VWFA domain-containing protein n=1 Tax=hydrothermal vent metagenome TaxID=652676 RepID=A0A3B1DQI4_9ZZZZ
MLLSLQKWLKNIFWAKGNRVWYGALYASTALHLSLMVILTFVLIFPAQQTETSPLMNSLWEAKEKPLEEIVQTTAVFAKDVAPSAGGESMRVSSFVGSHQASHAPRFQLSPPSLLVDNSAYEISQSFLAKNVGESLSVKKVKQKGSGNGKGKNNGNGKGNGTPFFGIRADGKRFVYVVDGSRSMNHPHPSKAKTRFKRLKMELIKSISELDPSKQFFVIFFNSEPIPMPANQMPFATQFNKKRYLTWVANSRADGTTDPRDAMLLAMSLNPDVIYFLTDGRFDINVVIDLNKIAQRQIVIHTYAFSNKGGEKTLKRIARRNRGIYTFVP